MLINCTICGSKSTILSRASKDPKVADLYCSCRDAECGHTFVMTLAFSHTLSPSAKDLNKLLIDMLRRLPKPEQLELIEMAGRPG